MGCIKADEIIKKENQKLSENNNRNCGEEKSGIYSEADADEAGGHVIKTDAKERLRLQEYDFVTGSNTLVTGDYVDVRIAFPNGVDCIVLSGKRLEGGSAGSIVLSVNEDEIMRMASARVDAKRYADCIVYAVRYAERGTEESICNYPVNREVYKAFSWNPNVKEISEAEGTLKYASRRGELEKGLEAYVIN